MRRMAALLFLLGCVTPATPPVPSVSPAEPQAKRGGELKLVQLEPAMGAALSEDSVVHAVIDYRIFHMDPAAHYGIMPIFADKAGEGSGFITRATLEEVRELPANSGRADLRFAVKPAWRDQRFGRPPSISFHLVMQYPESGIDAIAEIGPFSYQ